MCRRQETLSCACWPCSSESSRTPPWWPGPTERNTTSAAANRRVCWTEQSLPSPASIPSRAERGSASMPTVCSSPLPIAARTTYTLNRAAVAYSSAKCWPVPRRRPRSITRLRALERNPYAGANFLCADASRAVVIQAGDWLRVTPLPPGIHVLTNRDVNDASDPRLNYALDWLNRRLVCRRRRMRASAARNCAPA